MHEWTVKIEFLQNGERVVSHLLNQAQTKEASEALAAKASWEGHSMIAPGAVITAFPRYM